MARRFRFRLQTLLEVRQLREREAKRRVAAKYAEIARLDQLNTETAAAIAYQQEALLRMQERDQLDTVQIQRGRAWVAHLRRAMAQRQMQRGTLLGQLKELQAELRAARTQTRIIEKLRERRWLGYVRDRDREEQAAADELAQQLQGRQRVES